MTLSYDGTPIEHGHEASLQDLYREWWTGNSTNPFPSAPIMDGAQNAASKWINMFNVDDFATNNAWRLNNLGKLTLMREEPMFPQIGSDVANFIVAPLADINGFLNLAPGLHLPPTDIWYYRYVVEQVVLPDLTHENHFYRLPNTSSTTGDISDVPRSLWTPLDPTTDRYEILAFASVANAEVLGNVEVSFFHTNIDLRPIINDVIERTSAGTRDQSSHSFQFFHDYHATEQFWQAVKEETDFDKVW